MVDKAFVNDQLLNTLEKIRKLGTDTDLTMLLL